jgi:hypothetical protein
MAHCHRELLHAQWGIILDDEFLDAYTHGVVILCFDGTKRRFYLRIFTYSADYREKYVGFLNYCLPAILRFSRIVLAGIRNLGHCPCPRCLIPLTDVHNLGQKRDRARRVTLARVDDLSRRAKVSSAREIIYQKNLRIDSAGVERLLREQSLVPATVCLRSFI